METERLKGYVKDTATNRYKRMNIDQFTNYIDLIDSEYVVPSQIYLDAIKGAGGCKSFYDDKERFIERFYNFLNEPLSFSYLEHCKEDNDV